MGENSLWLNPAKNEWLWVLRPPSPVLEMLHLKFFVGLYFPSWSGNAIWGPLAFIIAAQRGGARHGQEDFYTDAHQQHPFLNQEASLTMTPALFTTGVDYCNVLYMGPPLKNFGKLQIDQDAVALSVFGNPHCTHVIPLFCLQPLSYIVWIVLIVSF